MREWKNIFYANGKQKKVGVAILISHKIDVKIKKITRDMAFLVAQLVKNLPKEGHYIMIKGSIQEEDITIVNIYTPNKGAPQYMTNTLTKTKGKINSNTKIVRDFNTPITPMDSSSKQKINKETRLK